MCIFKQKCVFEVLEVENVYKMCKMCTSWHLCVIAVTKKNHQDTLSSNSRGSFKAKWPSAAGAYPQF